MLLIGHYRTCWELLTAELLKAHWTSRNQLYKYTNHGFDSTNSPKIPSIK